MNFPFSQACENNKRPILEILQDALVGKTRVLEIGSGTGQHAEFFAEQLKNLQWQCSDRSLEVFLTQRMRVSGLSNVLEPIELDVETSTWPEGFDAAFSANTAHIMPWQAVCACFLGLAQVLPSGAPFVLYGPFNYDGAYTSESNAQFDAYLKSVAPHQGIRDIEAMRELGKNTGFALEQDNPMPANNRCLVWRRS